MNLKTTSQGALKDGSGRYIAMGQAAVAEAATKAEGECRCHLRLSHSYKFGSYFLYLDGTNKLVLYNPVMERLLSPPPPLRHN